MPDNPKSGRKDRGVVADAAEEIEETVTQERRLPKYENPNRDRTRGDWDRSRKHTNEP
jgi:hypothetical protein